MVSTAERERTHLENAGESQLRIELLLEVDRHFKRYELEFAVQNAAFAANAIGWPEIAAFIEAVNATSGGRNSGYSIRIGRQFGLRIVILDVFRGTFADAARIANRIEDSAAAHGARTSTAEGPDSVEVLARWD